MGSFNMGCFASQQTIAPGDRCRVLPILQQSTYSDIVVAKKEKQQTVLGHTHSTCYYDSFWSPIGNFIPAEYADYGRVELEFDPLSRRYLVGLFNELYQSSWNTEQGDNECHDLAFNFAAFLATDAAGVLAVLTTQDQAAEWLNDDLDEELTRCWDYVWEVVQKHRVFMSDYKGRPRVFDFAIIHEEAYAHLLEMESSSKDWDGVSLEPDGVLRKALETALVLAGERVEGKSADLHCLGGWHMSDHIREKLSRADGVGHSVGGPTSALVARLCAARWNDTITDDEFIEACLPLMNDRYVLAGLTRLNLRITPAVSAGQDYDNSEGRAYAKFIETVSAKVSRGRLLEMYGEFQEYRMQAQSQERIDALVDYMSECDAAIEKVVVTPAEDGTVVANFSCTLELEDLQELLREELEGGDAMADSLTVVSATD